MPVGMPVWQVSEPYISLWLEDEPLGYQPACGPRISFGLNFKQREVVAGYDTNIFSIGPKWNCSWLSYVTVDTNAIKTVYFPGGGSRLISGTYDLLTNTRVTGDTSSGYTVTAADGSTNIYSFIVTNNAGIFLKAFLTESCNPSGQKTRFYYDSYAAANPVIRLRSVVDGDGRTNTVSYTASNNYSTNLISQVVDPFGRTNLLAYDNAGRLTNITDVAGLTTALVYDGSNWVSSMTTPYGTTSFSFTDTSGTNVIPNGRSVRVTEPDGSHQLFLNQDSASGVAATYGTNEIPVTTPYGNTFETNQLNLRNSFHWNTRQYAALSTTNPASFTTNDFRKARMQHWLNGISLSLQREPSPDIDGAVEGQKTWYDYYGKTDQHFDGLQALPLFVGRILPDGTTTLLRTERNVLGNIVATIDTYAAASGVALRTNTLTYAANLIDVLAATNAIGVQDSSNVYNGSHQVLTNFNALNEKTVFTYDASNRLSRVIHPTGLVTTNIYGTDGFVAQTINTGIATNLFTYSNDLVATHTDARGLTTANTWDALQRLTSQSYPDGTTISNRYTFLDLTATKDRLGSWTYFGYDSLRRNTAITNALGFFTLYDYCSCGTLNSIRDAAGNYTYFFYDNAGRQTNVVSADGYSVTNTFNLLGQLTRSTDSGGTSVTNWFNNQGLIVTSSNAFGRISSATYDVLDRITNSVDASGVTITNTFDNLSRLLARGYPDGGVEKYTYTLNFAGLTSYTNQLGTNVVNYAYDAMGRKTNEVYPGISTNKYAYSGAGDLLTLTDGKNQTTTWHYDEYGRTTNKVDASSTEIFRFSYDPNGRLTNRWTATKGNTVYRYDFVGNLTNVDYAVSPDLTMQYDSLNRLTNLVDAVGTNRYTYDAASQLLSEDGPWASDTLTYTYANRLRVSLSLQQPSGSWTNGYLYDVTKRLTNVTSKAGGFGYVYPGSSPLATRLSLPNSAYITNSYDSVTRLLSTQLKNSGGTVLNAHTYAYNASNQRTKQTRTDGSYVDYTYDGLSQLKTALGKESGGATNRLNEQLGYTYDAAGNLNFRTNNALVQTFNNNSLNELSTVTRSGTLTVEGNTTTAATNVTVNGLTAIRYADLTYARTDFPLVDATTNFTAIAQSPIGLSSTNTVTVDLRATNTLVYDLNGNLRTNGTQILEYDDENRLVTNWVPSAWKSEFVYDGQQRLRIARDYGWQVGSWVKTNEVRLLYDGVVAIQERNAVNTPAISYTRSGSYLLARTDNATSSHTYYHTDGNRNVTTLINSSQLIVAKYLCDPYGNILAMSGPLAEANPYRFASQRYHANSGLVLYLRRAYSPSLQRFVNRDPIEEAGGINLYGFVGNNPISGFDLLGLDPSTSDLFWLNAYENGMSDAGRYFARLGNAGLGMMTTSMKSMLNPLGTAYDQYQGLANLSSYLGKLSDDPCERQRALDAMKNYGASPEASADAVVFVELLLAGRLGVPKAGVAAETTAGSRALVPYYPPNAGFAGASGEATLVPGTIVDRFGGTGGSFLSPQGTPAWARSLPFGAETRPLNAFEVVRPVNVNAGTAAPWFNQSGGGLQFDLGTRTVQDLINSGHLRPLQ